MIAKSVDGVITTWSPGASLVYGGDAEMMIGRNIEDLIPVDARDEEREIRRRVASGESQSGYQCVRLRVDGERIDVVMSMSPVREPSGRVVGVASISRPITPTERDALRFASLLEAAPDGILCVNAAGAISTANAQACAMFGYVKAELIGTQLSALLPENLRAAHSRHVAGFLENPKVRTMGIGLSLTARRRDGSTFPVEISLAPDTSGAETVVIAAVRDVTERRRLEMSSRESETRLRQLAESVNTLFILLQFDPPEVLYISPASRALFGKEPEEFLQTDDPLSLVVHPDDLERVSASFLTATIAGESATSEHRVLTSDGTERWVRAVSQPVLNPSGTPERSVVTVEDITGRVLADLALQQAEAAARSANEAKTHFLSRMSHELRTPLNAVLGFGQLLQYELQDTKHIDALNQIVKGGRHLLNLINDVLDVARIESGEMSISLEAVQIHDLLADSMQLMEPLAEASGILLLTAANDDDLCVLADRQRLHQVLLNLLSNAIKYNRRGGKVWVELHSTPVNVAVTVWDDGPGISPELQTRLFTPFDRLDAETTGIDGTGIGLSLTRSLTELMGGTVTVQSEPDHGSGFTVTLPRTEQTSFVDPLHPGSDGLASRPALRDGMLTLLYIEDNEPNVRVIESILTLRPEWRIIHAGQGGLGIELAKAHKPDLLLLDLHLPDRPGADVLAALKGDPDTRTVPVVIVTADATSGTPSRLLQSGAESTLTKPFELADLLSILDAHAIPPSGSP